MSFTDEDLKRLKLRLSADYFVRNKFVDARDMDALIARLEAGEILLERLTNPDEGYELEDVDEDRKFYLAWRKAAGK